MRHLWDSGLTASRSLLNSYLVVYVFDKIEDIVPFPPERQRQGPKSTMQRQKIGPTVSPTMEALHVYEFLMLKNLTFSWNQTKSAFEALWCHATFHLSTQDRLQLTFIWSVQQFSNQQQRSRIGGTYLHLFADFWILHPVYHCVTFLHDFSIRIFVSIPC